MSDEDFFEEEEDEGNPDGWMVTFSDLMSLLLCFFVLIILYLCYYNRLSYNL